MSIKRTYGDVQDYAGLGAAAGATEAAIRKEAQYLDLKKQTMAANAQSRLQLKQLQHATSSQEFQADVAFERDKQAHVWSLQEADQLNQFKLAQTLEHEKIKQDAQFAEELKFETRERSERDRKLKAINTAEENNQLSSREAAGLRSKISTGYFPQGSSGGSSIDALFQQLMGDTTVQSSEAKKEEEEKAVKIKQIVAGDIPDKLATAPSTFPSNSYGMPSSSRSDKPFVKKGILGFRKEVPVMPVIRQRIYEVLKTDILDKKDKEDLARLLQEGDEARIVEAFKRMQG